MIENGVCWGVKRPYGQNGSLSLVSVNLQPCNAYHGYLYIRIFLQLKFQAKTINFRSKKQFFPSPVKFVIFEIRPFCFGVTR